jgi:hypothetical protein
MWEDPQSNVSEPPEMHASAPSGPSRSLAGHADRLESAHVLGCSAQFPLEGSNGKQVRVCRDFCSRRRNSCAAPATVSDYWGVSRCHCAGRPEHRRTSWEGGTPEAQARIPAHWTRTEIPRGAGIRCRHPPHQPSPLLNSLFNIRACGGLALQGSSNEQKAEVCPAGWFPG